MSIFTSEDHKEFSRIGRLPMVDFVLPFMVTVLQTVSHLPGDPLKQLGRILKKTSGQLSMAMTSASIAAGHALGGFVWASSLGTLSSIGYALGIVALPPLWPIGGAVVGGAVGVSASMLLLSRLRTSDMKKATKLLADVLSVLTWADGGLDKKEEQDLADLRERLMGLGFDEAAFKDKFASAPRTADDLIVKVTDYDEDLRRSVLIIAWQMALSSDQDRSVSMQVFARLSRRLGLEGSMTQLQEQAVAEMNSRSNQLSAVMDAVNAIGSDLDASELETLMAALAKLDPQKNADLRRERCKRGAVSIAKAAGSIAAVVTGNTAILSTVGQAVVAVSSILGEHPEQEKKIEETAVSLLGSLGVPATEGRPFLKIISKELKSQRARAKKSTTHTQTPAEATTTVVP